MIVDCDVKEMWKAAIAAYFKALHGSPCTETEGHFNQDRGFQAENRVQDLQNMIQEC
jgi:hypothetical protein